TLRNGGMATKRCRVDGKEAAASVAYRASETIAIYPITPSSPMAEVCDEWSSRKRPNLWGAIPELAEMQSEAGAAGAVHGAPQAGAPPAAVPPAPGPPPVVPATYKNPGGAPPVSVHRPARTPPAPPFFPLRR